MKNRLFILMLMSCTLASFQAVECLPASYKFALKHNNRGYEGSYRELELSISDAPVGSVTYTIAHAAYKPSRIHTLHVQPEYRGKNGYGKILLYSAINDILMAGGTSIELTRSPFNLRANDNYSERDAELKRLYGSFGFIEKQGERTMILPAPQRFLGTEVVTAFNEHGISFKLRHNNR